MDKDKLRKLIKELNDSLVLKEGQVDVLSRQHRYLEKELFGIQASRNKDMNKLEELIESYEKEYFFEWPEKCTPEEWVERARIQIDMFELNPLVAELLGLNRTLEEITELFADFYFLENNDDNDDDLGS